MMIVRKINERKMQGWAADHGGGLFFSHLLLLRCDIFLLTSRFFERLDQWMTLNPEYTVETRTSDSSFEDTIQKSMN